MCKIDMVPALSEGERPQCSGRDISVVGEIKITKYTVSVCCDEQGSNRETLIHPVGGVHWWFSH